MVASAYALDDSAPIGRGRGRGLRWDPRDGRFTVEEYRVVQRVTLGYTDREIGSDLFMSEWTVRYHLRKVFSRFGLRRRIELVLLLSETPAVGDPVDREPSALDIRGASPALPNLRVGDTEALENGPRPLPSGL
ncbi:MAG TPA: LuxR C-terminal-related transcriptional regulator [Candidatus Saccharimonadales bacterium]|nr:LuxR C-terminal-related transcriptional regulator [Candidatus Saccharimonadales bacterium]